MATHTRPFCRALCESTLAATQGQSAAAAHCQCQEGGQAQHADLLTTQIKLHHTVVSPPPHTHPSPTRDRPAHSGDQQSAGSMRPSSAAQLRQQPGAGSGVAGASSCRARSSLLLAPAYAASQQAQFRPFAGASAADRAAGCGQVARPQRGRRALRRAAAQPVVCQAAQADKMVIAITGTGGGGQTGQAGAGATPLLAPRRRGTGVWHVSWRGGWHEADGGFRLQRCNSFQPRISASGPSCTLGRRRLARARTCGVCGRRLTMPDRSDRLPTTRTPALQAPRAWSVAAWPPSWWRRGTRFAC